MFNIDGKSKMSILLIKIKIFFMFLNKDFLDLFYGL